jgi:trimeric autotransporter adhesin
MNIRSFVLFFALVLGLTAAACGSSSTSPTVVSSITVTGTAPAVGLSSQFTATETITGGGLQDITGSATWTSSDSTVAIVSSTGLVTSLASGTVVIAASYSGMAGSESITVP